MSEGPITYRDQLLSIYQSAAAEVARQHAGPGAPHRSRMTAASARLTSDDIEREAADVAGRAFARRRRGTSGLEATSIGGAARSCAELALRYLEAKLAGDVADIAKIEEDFTAGTCDPAWATTISEYVKFFGPDGTRREIPYIRPSQVGEVVIEIKAGAKVALVSDWGTGAEPARRILRQIAALKPDVFVHLGDIYYSGTPIECDVNLTALLQEGFGTSRPELPVYVLAGNHDMYCGGVGFYELIRSLNSGPLNQPASFFCLRSSDERWQVLAMDTGLHDYSPLSVQNTVTRLEDEELEWHCRRVREFPGKTILLSHHQLFSAFSPIGGVQPDGTRRPSNPNLVSAFEALRGEGSIAGWFWGHEHSLGVYEPFGGLGKGRCIGHGAVPVFATDDIYAPVEGLSQIPTLIPGTKLSKRGSIWGHGFVSLTLSAEGPAQADYYEDVAGKAVLRFSEPID